ncbi:uncharacterized protein Z520_11869 [Fonsecaea multimorphosa CBS 102226]|uniref:CHK kinase-like domain-containing protein n=1 Tax=Fonsecaea multimorphosa CBS 102226 TaxID=1442371 RepID=A0A0D2JPM0_9EURO|nr:uncharacterized protein Z520_11869 [Fonsecaea multimorphosa CBS 102226]KIX92394.1 hypothetical protein Z520_11869 [Fonsecaea multimorphosa CBS 102226]OAL17766.1 hypothetical protein AYO22_11294 [Fonsecaea multimorphosa]
MVAAHFELSPQWLSKALGFDVVGAKSSRIGTGQIGEVHRIELEYGSKTRAGPASVVAKMASLDGDCKSFGIDSGLYEREVRFYKEVAPLLTTGPIPTVYRVERDEASGEFVILMSDNAGRVGSDINGATLEEAKLAMSELGRLHGLILNHVPLENHGWMKRTRAWSSEEHMLGYWKLFQERYGDRLKPEHREIGQKFIDSFEAYHATLDATSAPTGLVHGDYRLDNILFRDTADLPLTLVDWQTCYWGPILHDPSYFLGLAVTPEFRREHGEELLKIYHQALSASSPCPISIHECKAGVQMHSFTGMRQAITAASLVERTTRGDDLFLTMFERSCEHVIDTKALEVLPPPVPIPHLEPEAADDEMHPFSDHPLHNESWYFDVVDLEQQVGAWVRLGVIPNQSGSWYHALICGPHIPTVGVIDFEAPHPGKDLVVHGAEYTATHEAEVPLQKYRITVKGKGVAFDDPAAILQYATGRPVDVQMDLLFETDGHPYKWRRATRYEIPCKVTGTFSWDDQSFTFTKARGQRDHSWGPRDWWAADWVWTAFHFDDGTHSHLVHAKARGGGGDHPHLGVGYVQKEGEPLVEMTDVKAAAEMAANGLGGPTTITMAPLPLTFYVKPIGHAPLCLVAKDGRVAKFPRSWAEITTNDGRKGAGWLEWNINE